MNSTLAYFDLFDFAPTRMELEKYLLKNSGVLVSDTKDGFYYLKGRSELAWRRHEKYRLSEQKRKRAMPFLRLLAAMPGVRAVWLANSVAWGNARPTSDIDMVIVARRGKIWTARFFTTALLKMLQQRPGEQTRDKALCLSLYLSEDALNLERYKIAAHDIHFAFWAYQMYPLYDASAKNPNAGVYKKYQEANRPWLSQVFEQLRWTLSIPRWWIRQRTFEKMLKKILEYFPLESFLKKFQLRILPHALRSATSVILHDDILKLHTHDARAAVQRAWEEKVRMLQ